MKESKPVASDDNGTIALPVKNSQSILKELFESESDADQEDACTEHIKIPKISNSDEENIPLENDSEISMLFTIIMNMYF